MSREEAQQRILEKLDEVQQILDRLDPKRKCKYFQAGIKRKPESSRLAWCLYKIDENNETHIEMEYAE